MGRLYFKHNAKRFKKVLERTLAYKVHRRLQILPLLFTGCMKILFNLCDPHLLNKNENIYGVVKIRGTLLNRIWTITERVMIINITS